MNQKGQDKFNFFVPASISKSGPNGELSIKGIASSQAEDSDGEFLDPSGFDFQPLLKTGYFNWNHQAQKSPGAILGRPTSAHITANNEFYVEGVLYKGLEDAQKLYDLAVVLENEDPTRRLGFSIEGTATERDPVNPKRVRKARITGIAITHCPKNPNTLLSIMKGEYSEPFVDVEEVESEELEKSHDITVLCQHYLDCGKKEVDETSIRDFLKEQYPGCDSDDILVKDMCSSLSKSMGVTNMPAPESVEGKPKSMVESDKVDFHLMAPGEIKSLTKAQVFTEIYNQITTDPELAREVYGVIEQIKQNMSQPEITTETLKKAMEILNLAKTTETNVVEKTEIVKSEVNNTPTTQSDFINKQVNNLIKGLVEKGFSKEEIEEDLVEKGITVELYTQSIDTLLEKAEKELQVNQLSKSVIEEIVNLNKASVDELGESLSGQFTQGIGQVVELVKSQNQLLSAQSTLLKSQSLQNEDLQKALDESQEKLDTLQKSLNETKIRVEKVEKEPLPIKSYTGTKHVEKFEGALEKSEDGMTTYSLSNRKDREYLSKAMFERVVELRSAGQDYSLLEKAIGDLEIAKSFPNSALPTLHSMGIKVIQ